MTSVTVETKITNNELDFGSDEEDDEVVVKKKFMDEDEESESDEIVKKKPVSNPNKIPVPKILQDRPLTDYIFADANSYNFKSWKECFPDNKVTLRSLVFNPAWNEFFDMVESKPYFKGMERIFSDYLIKNKEIIIPHAELVFNSFNVLSPKKIRVVIIGQDPYPCSNIINGKSIPDAMGFSFSVPYNCPKAKSLKNIFENLHKFGHISKIPDGGCLSYWVLQGCFMINASLTTFSDSKNSHRNVWKNFTNDLLEYINAKCDNLVFMVWGKDAHSLCLNIDPKRHHIITSSHPSPLGFDKSFGGFTYGKVKNSNDRNTLRYNPFVNTDHFGMANKYFQSIGKREIMWDVIK